MAEFCEKCLKEQMGLEPKCYPEWLIIKGCICEGCGYKYLEKYDDKKDNGIKIKSKKI